MSFLAPRAAYEYVVQGDISPLLANVHLSALDWHFERAWKQQTR